MAELCWRGERSATSFELLAASLDCAFAVLVHILANVMTGDEKGNRRSFDSGRCGDLRSG